MPKAMRQEEPVALLLVEARQFFENMMKTEAQAEPRILTWLLHPACIDRSSAITTSELFSVLDAMRRDDFMAVSLKLDSDSKETAVALTRQLIREYDTSYSVL